MYDEVGCADGRRGLSRRGFLARGGTLALGGLLFGQAAPAVAGAGATPSSPDASFAALIGIVAASPELRGSEIDVEAARARLTEFYRDDGGLGSAHARKVVGLLDDAGSTSFARLPRDRGIASIRRALKARETNPSSAVPDREYVLAALRLTAEAITGCTSLPAPSYTLANGLVI